MAANQIQKVSIKHDAILDYLLVNPAEKLGDVAKHFDVSQAWLSVIIHSDAFQAKLTEKNSESFNTIVLPLREQMLGIGHAVVAKLGEVVENSSPTSDKQFIVDTADMVFKNLGYSPKGGGAAPGGSTTNNIFVVDKTALAAAREKMRTVPTGDLIEGHVIEPITEENGATAEKV